MDFWKICRPLLLTVCILCLVHRPIPSHVAGSYSGIVFGILIVSLSKPQIEGRNVVIVEIPSILLSLDMSSFLTKNFHLVRFFNITLLLSKIKDI
jgi:hypothetical protein